MTQTDVMIAILESLKPFVRERKIAGEPLAEHRLIDDLGVDSSRLIEVILELEDRFGIEIPDSATDGFRTLGDMVTYVTEKQTA